MSTITRTYTFTDGTTAFGSQVESEISNITTTWNNHDAGTSRWTVLDGSTLKIGGQDITQFLKWRRPVLQYSSGTVVNMEAGLTGTSGQVAIVFPDGTYRTDSTTGRINCNLAQTAALTGTAQSGLDTGSVTNNTWYSFYAVKSQSNTTDIVHVASLLIPTQANFSTLNSRLGSNSWVYLGAMAYGNGSDVANAVPAFTMAGNKTVFTNVTATSTRGLRLANTAGATSLTWTYAAGTALGSAQVPGHLTHGDFTCRQGSSATISVADSATAYLYYSATWGVGTQIWTLSECDLAKGLKINPGSSIAIEILLGGYRDGVLGINAPLM